MKSNDTESNCELGAERCCGGKRAATNDELDVEELQAMIARLLEHHDRFEHELNRWMELMQGEMRSIRSKMKAMEDKALLKKTSVASMFPWRLICIIVFALFGGLFAYDVTLHGSFQDSKTGRVMHDLGIIAVCDHAWIRIKLYSNKLYRWSEENIPIYLSALCAFCDPYLQLFWRQLYVLGAYLVEQTEDVRNYLALTIQLYLEWLNEKVPILVQKNLDALWNVWSRVQHAVPALGSPSHHGLFCWTWLRENIFVDKLSPENLERYIMNLVETIHSFTIYVYEWLTKQASTIMAGEWNAKKG